jgi:hypothetical protein
MSRETIELKLELITDRSISRSVIILATVNGKSYKLDLFSHICNNWHSFLADLGGHDGKIKDGKFFYIPNTKDELIDLSDLHDAIDNCDTSLDSVASALKKFVEKIRDMDSQGLFNQKLTICF